MPIFGLPSTTFGYFLNRIYDLSVGVLRQKHSAMGRFLKMAPIVLLLDACQLKRQEDVSHTASTGPSGLWCFPKSTPACPEPLSAFSLPTLPSDGEIEIRIHDRLHLTKAPAYSATELDPQTLRDWIKTQILPQYAGAGPHRVQIATGTERAFMTAQAEYVILADADPFVRLYNTINLELLKAAKDIGTYRKMRFAKSVTEWTKHGLAEGHDLIKRRTFFQFWTHAQGARFEGPRDSGHSIVNPNYFLVYKPSLRKKSLQETFGLISSVEAIPFAGDYVWDEGAFKELKARARAGRIAIRALDWTDSRDVDLLLTLLQKSDLTVATIDFGAIHLQLHENWETYAVDLWKKFAPSHRILTHLSFVNPRLRTADGQAKHDTRYYVLAPQVDARLAMKRLILKDLPQLESPTASRLTALSPDSTWLKAEPCTTK